MGTARMMARTRLVGLAFAALAAPFVAVAQNADDWIELFDGKSLDDWIVKIRGYPTGENFADTFRVEDGLLSVNYDGYDEFGERFGHIFYRQPFSHYRLRIEYRFTGEQVAGGESWATRNSGVMLHSQDPHTMPAAQDFPISLEAQFLGGLSDGEARPTGNLCTPGTHVVYAGKFDSTHCIESTAETYDGSQWVTIEVLVLGDERIVHYVEGDAVIEYQKPTFGGGVVSGHWPEMKPEGEPLNSGYIALQSESHPLQFRRIALLNLSGCMDPKANNFAPYYVHSQADACQY